MSKKRLILLAMAVLSLARCFSTAFPEGIYITDFENQLDFEETKPPKDKEIPLTIKYFNDPEATAAVLRDGVLSTGDLGFLDENGCLHITGRKKEILVLSDGTKIFLPEYEALLAEALPGRDFAAVLREGRPALLIRGNPGERDELLKKTAAVLKNMPRGQQLYAILFTGTPLPRTSAGKLKRKEIETIADTAGRSTS